jgi:hypothetical protein
MRHLLLLSLAVLCAAVSASPVHSQSRVLTPETLALRADVVALGTVAAVRSEWDAARNRIVSHVTVTVERYVKGGNAQPAITLTVPGGEIGDVGETYSHTARFTESEQVVVFAARDAQGTLRVTGGDRGKVSITEDRMTGKRMAGEGVTLEVFLSRVHSALAAPSQR